MGPGASPASRTCLGGALAAGRVCSRREPPRFADRTPLLLSPASAGAGRARGRLL